MIARLGFVALVVAAVAVNATTLGAVTISQSVAREG